MELRFKPYPEAHSLLSRVDDDSNQLTFDWSEVRFVKPSVLVAVAAMASTHSADDDAVAGFVPPENKDVCV